MLDKHDYYFHLPEGSGNDDNIAGLPYPIVPTFREWLFPHGQLPLPWTQIAPLEAPEQPQIYSVSGLTMALRQRDGTCRITAYREGLQTAHVCPRAEEDWYLRNGMPRYNHGNTERIDDTANALLLRADLHIAFDKPSFVFVPKPGNGGSQQFVLHLLEPSREFEALYHNRAMQNLSVSVELLFARFAWTIFPLLAGFLKGKVRRRLQLSTTIDEVTGSQMPPVFVSVDQCEDLAAKTAKSRNPSPKKCGRAEDSVVGVDIDTRPLEEGNSQQPQKRQRYLTSEQVLATAKVKTSVGCPSSKEPSPTTPALFHDPALLRQEWLNRERLHSDPNHLWEEESAWAAEVYKGTVTLGESNIERWLLFSGGELNDESLLD